MGIFPLILGRVRLMGLNSHLHTKNYVPSSCGCALKCTSPLHLRILWCISSTSHSTLTTINNLQIHHLRVQRCTLLFGSCCSGFRLWTKIFTTSVPTCKESCRDSVQRIRYGMIVRVCMYVRERERGKKYIDTENRIRKLMY